MFREYRQRLFDRILSQLELNLPIELETTSPKSRRSKIGGFGEAALPHEMGTGI